MIAFLLFAAAAVVPVLSDADLKRIEATPFDKGRAATAPRVIGRHNGVTVVADYFCSDVCPAYTVRVIHYDVATAAQCARAGGVMTPVMIPISIAVAPRPFCVPRAIAKRR